MAEALSAPTALVSLLDLGGAPPQFAGLIVGAGQGEDALAERLFRVGDLDRAARRDRAVVEHGDRTVGARHDDAGRMRRALVALGIFGLLDRGVDCVELARGVFAERHAGMDDVLRLRGVVGDHHGHADLGDPEQQRREFLGQPHAAVRGRIARQLSGVQRDPGPRQPVHVGHWRVVVGRGAVVLVLLQNLEDAGRRPVAELAGRAGRGGDPHAVAVDVHELVGQRDDDEDRTARRALGIPGEFAVLELLGVFVDALGERRREGEGRRGDRGGAAELTAIYRDCWSPKLAFDCVTRD